MEASTQDSVRLSVLTRATVINGTRSARRPAMKMTRKIIFAILIGLSLFAAASAISTATHASAATAIEYG